MPSVKINRSVSGAVTGYSSSEDVQAGALSRVEEIIPAGATDLQVAFVADVSQIAAFLARAAVGNLTVKTNDASSPANTFELGVAAPGNILYPGYAGDQLVDSGGSPITTDITSLFVTNAGEADAVLHVDMIFDPTV